ncbi:MAG TPA: flagellar assembly protein FliW [Pirellulales bacterium]|jgi:flagellar assembly factor FliW
MQVRTTRFANVEVQPEDLIRFSDGMLGLEDCSTWVLLADAQNDALGWLQSTTRPEVALAVVSPRRFVPEYQLRVYRRELASLRLAQPEDAQVLVIVGKNERGITLNLKAPIVMNLEQRLARQVIANGDLSLRHELAPTALRKTA